MRGNKRLQQLLCPDLKPIEIELHKFNDMTVDEIKQTLSDVIKEIKERVMLWSDAEIEFVTKTKK